MRTTVYNDGNPRRRRRRAKRRYSRRRNEAANPRRRRRPARRHYRRNVAPATNPRRRRRGVRRNPAGNPELNFSRILYATGGGALARLGMRKIAGLREMVGGVPKLTGMHYLTALGAIYFGPDIADILGATPEEARAFADGAAAIGGNMMLDQHLPELSAAHLMPFNSPTPTGADVRGIRGGAGAGGIGSKANPMAFDEYKRAAGMGQLPGGGVYVRGADGSVWWFPGRTQARAAIAGNSGAREIPDDARIGDVFRDTSTGERFRLVMDNGQRVLVPAVAGQRAGLGASYSDYYAAAAGR
jgi:hypothetical protein